MYIIVVAEAAADVPVPRVGKWMSTKEVFLLFFFFTLQIILIYTIKDTLYSYTIKDGCPFSM